MAVNVPSPIMQSTTLSNGLAVVTDTHPHAQTATVSVWIDMGLRVETDKTNGTPHFFEHMAFKGTNRRTQHALELEVENLGVHLNVYTSREQMVYYAKSFHKDVGVAVDIISDILQNSELENLVIEWECDVILWEQQEVDKQLEEVVFDHLHSVAFTGQPLGRTILGPKANIVSISHDNLVSYIKMNYTTDRSIAWFWSTPLAEKHFSALPVSSNPIPLGRLSHPKTKFIGQEVHIHDDTMPTAHVAIAVEGVGQSSPDYYPMLVMQLIFGNWGCSLGAAGLMSSRLSHIISSHNLANSFMSFSTSYSDTGLWGIYLVTENVMNMDDLAHFALMRTSSKQWLSSDGEDFDLNDISSCNSEDHSNADRSESGGKVGPITIPGDDASIEVLREAIAAGQLAYGKQRNEIRKLKAELAMLKGKRPSNAKSVTLSSQDNRIAFLGREYSYLIRPWIDETLFRVAERPAIDLTSPERYGTSTVEGRAKLQEAALVAELFDLVPEDLCRMMKETDHFGSVFTSALNGARHHMVLTVQRVAAQIFKLDPSYFGGKASNHSTIPQLQALLKTSPTNQKYTPFAPVLYPIGQDGRHLLDSALLFRSEEVALVLKVVVHGPASLNGIRACNSAKAAARKYGIISVTPALIALSCIVTRLLSQLAQFLA
ncbi:hypothetical protein WOLCODRAFT_145751 [Wolfiporia cocos MD-104 SS10]|uniref:mitochondrial processing peptidase n=1 Tax=Wolfiporia cocos (strain MD-104) TaxID=742152 RepID=A0A2H3IZ69_WOLCO|nr:hypothetical protein WOLCODRAFT_145751 [Wolfiporia cocos MD-104 SS10]